MNKMTVKLIHLHLTIVKNDHQICWIFVKIKQTRRRKIAVNFANDVVAGSVGLRQHQHSQREINSLEF